MTSQAAVTTPTALAVDLKNRPLLSLPRSEWKRALVFLLSLAGLGLGIYPIGLLTLAIMINSLIKDRYDFLIQLMILATGYGFVGKHVLSIRVSDLVMILSFAGLLVYRKDKLTKRVLLVIAGYIIFLLVMSTFSDESFSIQLLTIRQYSLIIATILPLWFFADRDFDSNIFFGKVVCYFLIICAFYAIDGFILQGWVLTPNTSHAGSDFSTFTNIVWAPLSTWFPRKYPNAMYIIVIAAYPLSRCFRLKWWQWGIVIVAFCAMRTMTVISAFVLTYIIFQGHFGKVIKYALGGLILISAVYLADNATGGRLRVAFVINQFANVMDVTDEEDLAEFGTSRMAQVIPKWEALVDQKCVWQGFGFLHPDLTTLPRYQIENELYVDIEQKYENVAITEITMFNTILNIGIIGLIVQTCVYLGIYFMVRKKRLATFYLSTLLMATVMGFGGFAGLNLDIGVLWVATALGICLLEARRTASPLKPATEPATTDTPE